MLPTKKNSLSTTLRREARDMRARMLIAYKEKAGTKSAKKVVYVAPKSIKMPVALSAEREEAANCDTGSMLWHLRA